MDVPDGWKEYAEDVDESEDCVELLKTIYGISQASRAFYKFISRILRDIGFEGGDVDPCLMQWKSPHGIVMVGIYVDDLLCVGKAGALELLEEKLIERKIKIKTEKTLKDYLSCEIWMNSDKTKAILRQPHLLKTLEEIFGELVRNLPNY